MSQRRSVVAIRHVAFEDLGLIAGLLDPDLFDVANCEAARSGTSVASRTIRSPAVPYVCAIASPFAGCIGQSLYPRIYHPFTREGISLYS